MPSRKEWDRLHIDTADASKSASAQVGLMVIRGTHDGIAAPLWLYAF